MSTGLEVTLDGAVGGFQLDLAFAAPAHGITALFGPSGAGKTSILRAVAGLDRLAGGRIRFAGETWQRDKVFVPPHRRPIGYVFQEANLFGHLSVAGNLRFGLTRAAAARPVIGFDEAVARLGLGPLLPRDPATLSGGERQRVAIGRALLAQPRLLLIDEPLSAVDLAAREAILDLLETLCRDLAIPALYVSHDLAEVTRLAHRLVLVERGRVTAAGPIAHILTDLALPLAAAPQAGVVLDAVALATDAAYGLTQYRVAGAVLTAPSRGLAPGASCRLRVLASDVSLCRTAPAGTTILNILPGSILDADSFDGMQTNVLIRLGEGEGGARLLARVTRKSWESLGLTPGQAVHALVKGVGLLEG